MGTISKYGTIAVSVFVLAIFGVVIALAMSKTIPDSQSMSLLLGSVVSMATTVVMYWCGSSSGSASKDATIHQALTGTPTPAPTPPTPTATPGA